MKTSVATAVALVQMVFFRQDHQTLPVVIEILAFDELFHGSVVA
jgi:hypothetical protein